MKANGEQPVGIVGIGAYLPRLRLSRRSIVEANGWFNSGLRSYAGGERTMCAWDEDSLTMAVEAARDCLDGADRAGVRSLVLASTTAPFADRSSAVIASAAIGLASDVATLDAAGSRRAGTSALIACLPRAGSGGASALVIATDHRRSKAGSMHEIVYGDGAAAVLLGTGEVAAEILATHQETCDLVDQFRASDSEFDYGWEERWVREEGYLKIVPPAVGRVLEEAGLVPGEVGRFILPCTLRNVGRAIASRAALEGAKIQEPLDGVVGDTGTAHPLLMLVQALEEAQPGEVILVIGWGQGCDCILLRATENVSRLRPRLGVSGHLRRGRQNDNYFRFLAFNDIVRQDKGMRGEFSPLPGLSSQFRNRDLLTSLVGGRCRRCGTAQIPRARVCVHPNCHAVDSQDPYRFAERPARLQSWTADHLTYSPDPPTHFGMVVFDEGGRMMADIVDVAPDEVETGAAVRMVFRIRQKDFARGNVQYFWKARPEPITTAHEDSDARHQQ